MSIEDYDPRDQLAPAPELEAHRPEHLYPSTAERACVGLALMRGVKAMDTIRALVRADDFEDHQARAAFAALIDLDEEGELPVDGRVSLVAVLGGIRASGDGGRFPDGQEQLHRVFLRDEPAFGGGDAPEVAARIVASAARLRMAIEHADTAGRSLRTREDLARSQVSRQFLEGLSSEFAELANRTVSDEPAVHISVHLDRHDEIMAARLEGNAAVVETRIGALDELLDGLDADAGDFVVIAARPSMGKTALLQAIARGQCVSERSPGSALCLTTRSWAETWRPLDAQVPVLIASAEMDESQFLDRLVADLVTMNNRQIQRPVRKATRATDLERWHRVAPMVDSAKKFARTWPISFVDRPRVLEEIERTAKGWRRAHPVIGHDARGHEKRGPALMMIDHLTELDMVGGRPKGMREDQYYGEIGKRLKALAKELRVVLILLMQLSRKVESRDDKRPLLSDLREAGKIEELADAALFCYRESYYGSGDGSEAALWSRFWNMRRDRTCSPDELDRVLARATAIEIIARKVRQGSVGIARAAFLRAYTRVVDRAR